MSTFLLYIPVLFVFIPILTSIIIYLFKGEKITFIAFIAQAILTVLIILYAIFLPQYPESNQIVFGGHDIRIGISLRNDTLSMAFVTLTIIIWWAVMLYTYKNNRTENKYFFFLLFLQGIFMGLLQTNDLFNLFVFLELITVLVTILIAYKKNGPSFRAAIYYLLLNTVGAMVFLIGVILLYYVYGTINIQVIAENIATHSATTTVSLAYIFMMAGISVKAALVPVFTWLPKAHGVAQSSISALLSGLIVKGALYLFIRINSNMFAGANYNTNELFFWIGTTTAIVGVAFALSQKEMKQVLAYHTISQVGIMMMGLSSIIANANFGGVLHIFNHAFFKGLLFLGAGAIIKNYQNKKVTEVRGVFKTMPVVAIFMIIGMLSISGAPFFNGFISKSFVKYAIKDDIIKTIIFYIINLGTMTSFIKFSQILFGPKQNIAIRKDHLQIVGMGSLAFLCIAIGIAYIPIANNVLSLGLPTLSAIQFLDVIEYFILVGIGYAFYRLVIAKDFLVTRSLRHFRISFENSNYLFIIYLLILALIVIIKPF